MEKELSSVCPDISNVSNQVKRIITSYYAITDSDFCSDKVHYLLGYLNNFGCNGVLTFSPNDLKCLICWINLSWIKHNEKGDFE